jgi:hypothetical protein
MQIVFVMVMCAWAFDRSVNAVAVVGTALVIAPTAWLLMRPKATANTSGGHKPPEDSSSSEGLRPPLAKTP